MESRHQIVGLPIITILFFFLFFTGAQSIVYAKSQLSSYCCSNGKVYSSSSKQCSGKKELFQTKNEAIRKCTNSTSGGKSSPATTSNKSKPDSSMVSGYCCLQGKVKKSYQKECKKRKGLFSTTRVAAQKSCNNLTAYCCVEGEVEKSNVGECRKFKQTVYFDQRKAVKACGQTRGFCCDDGDVTTATKSKCDQLKGGFHISKTGATNQCLDTKGFCVLGENIKKLTKGDCLKKKGSFALTKVSAGNIVNSQKGYCCVGDHVASIKKSACLKKKGTFSLKRHVALQKCRDNKPQPGKVKKDKQPYIGKGVSHGLPSLIGVRKVDSDALVNPDLNPPDRVMKSIHGDINIINPAGGERYYKGETVPVLFRFSGGEPTAGEIHVAIMNRAAITAGSAAVSAGSRQAYVTLSDDVPNGEYFVMITYSPPAGDSDGGAEGVMAESRFFSLHRNHGRIDFLSPDSDSVIHPGGTMDVTYKLNSRVEPGPITFALYNAGSVVATETVDFLPSAAYRPERERSFVWRLPGGLPDSDQYVILATHSVATGMSKRLAVRPIRIGGGGERPFDLRISEIYRENNSHGRVIARVFAGSGFISGTVDFRVRAGAYETTISERVVSGVNEVVVGEMPEPVLRLGMEQICAGVDYTVTVDPGNRYSELDEGNNVAGALLHSVDELVDVSFQDTEGHSISSGNGTRIPCDLSDYEYRNESMKLFIKNCGSTARMSGNIVVRQSGSRRASGRLGTESFDEVIPDRTFYDESLSCSARELSVPSGRRVGCVITRIELRSLTAVDSTLTFTGGPLERPYTVNLSFGERDFTSGECRY